MRSHLWTLHHQIKCEEEDVENKKKANKTKFVCGEASKETETEEKMANFINQSKWTFGVNANVWT